MKKFAQISLLTLLFVTCKNDTYDVINDAIYLFEAQSSQLKKISTDDQDHQFQIPVRASRPVREDVQVEIQIDEDFIDRYNEENGTELVLLPEAMYSLSSTHSEIFSGELNAEQIVLTVKGFPEEMSRNGASYAIPVKLLSNSSNYRTLDGSDQIMYICDPVITTSAAILTVKSGQYYHESFRFDRTEHIDDYTLELKLRKEGLVNGAHVHTNLIFAFINEDVSHIVSHLAFGDMGNNAACIQMNWINQKVRGQLVWESDKWYHVAVVKKDGKVSIYRNGVLDTVLDVIGDHEYKGFRLAQLERDFWRGDAHYSELRVWNYARTIGQIMDNIHAVDPTSPGLLSYYKFNEGSGQVIKDYGSMGHDIELLNPIVWEHDLRSDTWFD